MATAVAIQQVEVPRHHAHDLAPLARAVGHRHFADELLKCLDAMCGAEHFTLFRKKEGAPRSLLCGSRDGTDIAHRQFSLYVGREYWQVDPGLSAAVKSATSDGMSVIRLDTRTLSDGEFRRGCYERMRMRERILICGAEPGSIVGLSLPRAERFGLTGAEQLRALGNTAPMLLAILSRHLEMLDAVSDLRTALTSLPLIEAVIESADSKLTYREMQVCARILVGISCVGIALDLGIAEETVTTYRKRAYQRLEIGCQRELLLWYVNQLGLSNGQAAQGRRPGYSRDGLSGFDMLSPAISTPVTPTDLVN